MTTCGSKYGERGARVAFGNTLPRARELVNGRRARGVQGGPAFNPATGLGYVHEVKGEYSQGEAMGNEPVAMLVETFGGFGPGLEQLLTEGAELRSNKLNRGEYDMASWSTRNWRTLAVQRISVAAHLAFAWEIVHAMGIGMGVDGRAPPSAWAGA